MNKSQGTVKYVKRDYEIYINYVKIEFIYTTLYSYMKLYFAFVNCFNFFFLCGNVDYNIVNSDMKMLNSINSCVRVNSPAKRV